MHQFQLRNHHSPAAFPSTPGRTLGGSLVLALGGLALSALAAGCNKEGAANPAGGGNAGKVTGTIGFVDLDRVSSQINWRSEADNDFKAAQAEVIRQLQVFQNTVSTAWEAKKKSVSDAAHLTAEQQKTLNGMNGAEIQKLPLSQAQREELGTALGQANQSINEARQKAEQTLNAREGKILESFREAMKPSVRRVAIAANISMVIAPPANANPVFYYDPSVDLTDQVVDDMRKAMPQHTLPDMPKLNLPAEVRFNTNPTTTGSPLAPGPVAAPSTRPG